MRNLWLVSGLGVALVTACTLPSGPEAPTPEAKNPALTAALVEYLEPTLGDAITVEYELLRDEPTQVGVAIPKYYVWLVARQGDLMLGQGAARLAAVDADQ